MPAVRITLIGAGTIGLSFAALHLGTLEEAELVIYDTRPDIERYIHETLPGEYNSPQNSVAYSDKPGNVQGTSAAAPQGKTLFPRSSPQAGCASYLSWMTLCATAT